MSALYDLIDKVAETNPQLAKAIANEVKAYTDRRPFGLNFERHTPENVRLYGRRARKGDLVNILPPRGSFEKTDNKVAWRVSALNGDTATLTRQVNDEHLTESASTADLVVLSEFDKPIFPGLKKTGEIQRGGDKPYQVVINGENYHALKALLYPYEEKVDCIYIDPPYNTGAHDWKYNNDYVDSNDAYQHSKWLAMMERRLKLAKRLLNPKDSVLIVTIDEKEYLRLGLLLEQTFPSARIQMITAVINPSGSSRGSMFSRSDEYIFIVFIGEAEVQPTTEDMLHERIIERPVRWDGLARRGATGKRSARPNLFYPVYFSLADGSYQGVGDAPDLNVQRNNLPVPEGCFAVFPIAANGEEATWGVQPSTFIDKQSKGYIKFGPWKPASHKRAIYHLQEGTIRQIENGSIEVQGKDEDGTLILGTLDKPIRPMTTWTKKDFSAGDYGSTLLRSFIPKRSFPFPKSLYAVEDTLRFFVANKPNALILDFFAGSGTTAHAVMRLNHQDNGCRRCICVTNNEVSEDEGKKLTKAEHRQGDAEWEQHGICEYISKPRIKAAIIGETPDGTPIKGNYKFSDEFPMSDGFEENAVFYDLTYEDEINVELDHAFEAIAPLLWLRAGSEGRCIAERRKDYDIADTYAVLFDYRYSRQFLQDLGEHDGSIRLVCIVTDQDSRYQDVAMQLPDGVEPLRLYESYLRSFKINQGED